MFVAGFIGSPQMNFIDVKIEKEESGLVATFGNSKVAIPEGKSSALSEYVGKEIVMGIRPEDIYDDEAFVNTYPNATVDAFIEVTEMMGAETYLHFVVDGSQITARVNARSTSKANETIKAAFDMNRAHFFDKETELAIR